jgi:prepilin-type N-terminal cleavage/methylation domain-containing protein
VRNASGVTLIELLTVVAISGILCAVAVPGTVVAGRSFACESAAHRLALVLRASQARAQAAARPVRVTVAPGGHFEVAWAGEGLPALETGDLGAPVSGTYPSGSVEFAATGVPSVPGGSPRAGHFTVGAGPRARTVTLQLGGCVRCA